LKNIRKIRQVLLAVDSFCTGSGIERERKSGDEDRGRSNWQQLKND
jgi:hypothetical protein